MDLAQLEVILATGFLGRRQPDGAQPDCSAAPDSDNDNVVDAQPDSADKQPQRSNRSEKVTVRMTPAQKRSLLQWCRGMDLSTYIRLFVFDMRTNQMLARLIPTVNRQTYLELMQINEVIRQQSAIICQQLSNSGQPNDSDFDNKLALHLQQLQQLEALIQEIRLTLIAPNGAIKRQL